MPAPPTRPAARSVRSRATVQVVSESAHVGEATYHALRQAILSCALVPGGTLTETQVMERFGVGKSTCRLALARLTQEGFVRSVPRQGYVVTPVTVKDVEELFEMRLLLEPAAARLAAGRADVRALQQLEAVARRNTASHDRGNRIGYFLDANREFHLAIAAASGNGRLVAGVSALLDEMKRLVALGFIAQDASPEIAHDHDDLIEALRRGDGDEAAAIATRHVRTFRDMALDKVMQTLRANQQSFSLTALA